jgi:hypothetical protein
MLEGKIQNREIAQVTDLENIPSSNLRGGIFSRRSTVVIIVGYLPLHLGSKVLSDRNEGVSQRPR